MKLMTNTMVLMLKSGKLWTLTKLCQWILNLPGYLHDVSHSLLSPFSGRQTFVGIGYASPLHTYMQQGSLCRPYFCVGVCTAYMSTSNTCGHLFFNSSKDLSIMSSMVYTCPLVTWGYLDLSLVSHSPKHYPAAAGNYRVHVSSLHF